MTVFVTPCPVIVPAQDIEKINIIRIADGNVPQGNWTVLYWENKNPGNLEEFYYIELQLVNGTKMNLVELSNDLPYIENRSQEIFDLAETARQSY